MSIRNQIPGDGAPFPAVVDQLPPWWLVLLFLLWAVGAMRAAFREGRKAPDDLTLGAFGAALLRILAWPVARWWRR